MTHPRSVVALTRDARLQSDLAAVLGAADILCVSCTTGAELLNSLSEHGKDVALIDFDLPEDGLTTARAVRMQSPDTPILLLSTRYRSFSEAERSKLPADEVLCNPCTFFELVDTCNALLRGMPTGARDSRSSAQLPLRGNLSEYSFELLLYKLFDARFTGRLVLQRKRATRVLYFLRGFPSSATSNTHTEALGSLLVNRGLVRRSDLNRILENLDATRGIGQQLIDAALITPDVLLLILDEQVRERALSCFEMRMGEWSVYPGDAFVAQRDHFIQNPIELIYLGLSRFEETNALAERIQQRIDHHVIPTRHFAHLVPYFPMGYNRRSLLAKVNGERTVGDLFRAWNGDLPAFFRVVWSLHSARLIFMSPSPIPAELPPIDKLLLPADHIGSFLNVRRKKRSNHHISSTFQRLVTTRSVQPVDELFALEHNLDETDHFSLFGISPMATPLEIRAAVERKVKLLDPLVLKHLPADRLSLATRIGRRLKLAASVLLEPDAREQYRAQLAPGSSESDVDRAIELLKAGRLEESHEILSLYEQTDPTNAKVCAYLGRALHLLSRQLPRAQALLFRAMALDDDFADPHFFMAEILVETGKVGQARASVSQALALDPNHRGARLLADTLRHKEKAGTVPITTLLRRED